MSKEIIPQRLFFAEKLSMDTKWNGLIGIFAVAMGALSIIVMAELRTDGYNHFHKAVSELGSLDAPNKWIFNVLGFILPGIGISIFSLSLLKEFRSYRIKAYPFYFLTISGLLLSFAGIFPGDMENRESFTTLMHGVGALGGGVFWLLSALTLWWQLKKNKLWKNVAIATFSIPFIMFFAMSFVSENTPGLSQRIVFAAMYLFILILAVQQLRSVNKNVLNTSQL